MSKPVLSQLAAIRGSRRNRKSFNLAILLCSLCAIMAMPALMNEDWTVALILFLPFMWIQICLFAQRLRDVDRSPWFVLLMFVPIASIALQIYLSTVKGTTGDNRYGKDPLMPEGLSGKTAMV